MDKIDPNKQSPFVPAEILEAALQIVDSLNPDRELMAILIVVENGAPPSMVSSIHPESIPDLLQFLIDHQKNATAFANGEPVNQKRN